MNRSVLSEACWQNDARGYWRDAGSTVASLSSFVGLGASGDWSLFLADLQSGGSSMLESLSLQVTAVPEPYQYGLVVGAGLIGFVVWRQRSRL
jgi:hypothetical protein